MILAIDPGTFQSAYILVDREMLKPIEFGIIENNFMLEKLRELLTTNIQKKRTIPVIEWISSYNQRVGQEVFETCRWAGRFEQIIRHNGLTPIFLNRTDIKKQFMHSIDLPLAKINDTVIKAALINRFGSVGTKKNPGWFYGFKKDIWQAYAVVVAYYDSLEKEDR